MPTNPQQTNSGEECPELVGIYISAIRPVIGYNTKFRPATPSVKVGDMVFARDLAFISVNGANISMKFQRLFHLVVLTFQGHFLRNIRVLDLKERHLN